MSGQVMCTESCCPPHTDITDCWAAILFVQWMAQKLIKTVAFIVLVLYFLLRSKVRPWLKMDVVLDISAALSQQYVLNSIKVSYFSLLFFCSHYSQIIIRHFPSFPVCSSPHIKPEILHPYPGLPEIFLLFWTCLEGERSKPNSQRKGLCLPRQALQWCGRLTFHSNMVRKAEWLTSLYRLPLLLFYKGVTLLHCSSNLPQTQMIFLWGVAGSGE